MAEPPDAPRRRLPSKGRGPGRRPSPRPAAPARPAFAPASAAPGGSSAAALAAAPVERGFGGGWLIVAGKELADHILSARFYVLVVVLSMAAAGAVYGAASGIQSAAGQIASQPEVLPAPFLALFTVSPQVGGQSLPSFYALIGLLGPLLGIAFGFDAVSSERSEKTLPRLLAQPIHRDDVVNGKFAAGLGAIGGILVAVVVLVAGLGLFQLGIVPTPEAVFRLAAWLVVSVIYVGLWLAFATLCSVVMRRAATAALVAIALWIVLILFGSLLAGIAANALSPLPSSPTTDEQIANSNLQEALARVSPATLYAEATGVLLDPTARSVDLLTSTQTQGAVAGVLPLDQSLLLVWPQITVLVAETSVCFAVAYISFMRQEVRA